MPVPIQVPPIAKPFKLQTQPLMVRVAGSALALVFSAMCVVLVATFLIQVTRVAGPSMEPTLENRDCLLVDRLSYEGDHRNDSSDSREWGLVPRKYVIGKVTLRWWPLQHFKVF